MKTHVLDANAIHRFLRDGPGAEIVEEVFKEARHSSTMVLMSVINWGEVHYTFMKEIGLSAAKAALRQLDNLPVTVLAVDMEQALTAAGLQASYGLHYADCFAAGLAGKNGVVVTSDVKDFSRISWLQIRALPPRKS
jgi:predicted nucleic acid-binding protein